MFELNQLEIFVAVVEEGSVSKAAAKLLISQPALSKTIQKLENELDLNLFDRTKNKLSVNNNGKMAYKKAKKLLSQAYRMKNELVEFDHANCSISLASCTPAPIWAIKEISNKKIESTIIDNSNEMIEGLKTNKYSLIVLNQNIKNKDFVCVKMFSEKLYISVIEGHRLATKASISFKELNGESIILSNQIGFWSKLCQINLPNSHLLYQDDKIYHEIVEFSTLPSFITNITIKKFQSNDRRLYIPINDLEATCDYYLYFKKSNLKSYKYIKENLNRVKWIK